MRNQIEVIEGQYTLIVEGLSESVLVERGFNETPDWYENNWISEPEIVKAWKGDNEIDVNNVPKLLIRDVLRDCKNNRSEDFLI
jgi:hypothetical protein